MDTMACPLGVRINRVPLYVCVSVKGAWGGGEGGRGTKKFFSAPRASFWSKNKEGGWAPRAPPLDPPVLY